MFKWIFFFLFATVATFGRAEGSSLQDTVANTATLKAASREDCEAHIAALLAKQEVAEANHVAELRDLGIATVLLFIFYLIYTRSILAKPRMIEWLGGILLLAVFELINLRFHHFLQKQTHHNALLMLLALMIIASILVPMHHKLEKFLTQRLITRNNRIRKENAEKTLEEIRKYEAENPEGPAA